MTTKKSFEIVNGPSQWRFILSLFEGDTANRQLVDFTVELNGVKGAIRCGIESVLREDGSGFSWMFDAHVDTVVFDNEGKGLDEIARFNELREALAGVKSVHGHYNMRTRKGWLERKL
jgi:hypothetical protein